MTREDIIRLALEAGFDVNDHGEWVGDKDGKCLERFASFVAAVEREACAKVCEEIKCGMWEESKKHRETRLRDASDGAGVCTYAIRARGNE
jgi:hypothetical protein